MRLMRLSGDAIRPMRLGAERQKEVKLLGHCRRATVLGVVSTTQGVSITAVVTAVTETP